MKWFNYRRCHWYRESHSSQSAWIEIGAAREKKRIDYVALFTECWVTSGGLKY
ncbi:MAG: hypothetical protein ABF969_08630 [Sporolactobacillus sp.]